RVVDTVSLTALVKRLPERDRRVLYLRFYRECTQQQIADAIGVSQMQVSRILRRCFDRLREALLAGEPCAGAGEAARGPATGRADRPARAPYGRRGAEEPVCPVGAAGPAPRTRPAGPAPRAAAGTGPRRGHGHPVRRRRTGSRRRTYAGAEAGPRTARARPPPARRAREERAPSPTGFVPPAEG
ncbi:sigma-70 family RNA polymerase sigma factor, partial [Streptomyces sp. NPDC005009]